MTSTRRLWDSERDALAGRAQEDARTLIGTDTVVATAKLHERARGFVLIELERLQPRGIGSVFKKPRVRADEIEAIWLEQASTLLHDNKEDFARLRAATKLAAEREHEERLDMERKRVLALKKSSRRSMARRTRPIETPTPPPAPPAYPLGVAPRGAELLVRDWMRHLGAQDAEVTQFTGDGGIDVISANWIAQVKHHVGAIGVEAIRELAGVAAVDKRRAAFFTSTGYATGAIVFADSAGIALLVYSAEEGTLTGINRFGVVARQSGFK